MPSDRTFVIAGPTLAGAKTAETLPREGVAGRMMLIGAEHGIPLEGGGAVKRGVV
jgi:3-phenylpropionate/trans-cinnamate dioxygenase ferredoxin reductase subunit